MRVNLNQLCVFYLAARHKSMVLTAKALYVSPPAVTMQIKKLEKWLGFPVFERGSGELRLTERGRSLYEAVEPTFKNLDALEREIQDLVQAEEGEIRLGSHHLPANYHLPAMLERVRAACPKLKVRMELGTQDTLLEKLFRQELDLVLILDKPAPGTRCVPLFDEDWPLVTAADGELGAIEEISAKDLAAIPLIVQQQGTGALRTVLNYLSRHNVRPNILLDNLSSDVIKQFLRTMRAAAFIGRFIVQQELDEGVFREIKVTEGPPVCRFYLAYPDNQHTPAKVKNFLAAVAEFSPDLRR